MNRAILLDKGFVLNKPADISVIQNIMEKYDFTIPPSYVDFLLISNGLYA